MKKLIALVLLTISTTAIAGPYGHNGHGHWHHHSRPGPWVWVAPAVIGGMIGYEISRNQPVVVQQQPVIVQQPVVVQQQNCSPWTEIQMPDGRIYKERTCTQ
jgi:hypothetical protein